jgi:hypothetical protein
MKKALIILSLIIILIVAWNIYQSPRNDEISYVVKGTPFSEVELTGTRRLMVHDPISGLFPSTSEVTYTIRVPRILGKVNGSEISVEEGYYKYIGNIIFKDGKMNVDLYYDNTDDGIKTPLSWNDEYTLVIKEDEK